MGKGDGMDCIDPCRSLVQTASVILLRTELLDCAE